MKRADFWGFTIGSVEVVFCKARIVCVAITTRRGVKRLIDK